MVIVTSEIIIKDPAKRDEIIAVLAEEDALSQSRSDSISHGWYANVLEPNQIRLYLEYENYDALLAAEKDPAFGEWTKRYFEYVQSGALEIKDNVRRYELGNKLPPMYGTGVESS